MDRKIYGSVTMPLLTFTNTENVTVDKELFIKKLSEEGVTNLNGRVSFGKTGLGGIRHARIDIWSPSQQIEIIGSTPVTTTIASEKFAEWGIYVEVSYLDEISQSVSFTLTDFTSTTCSGTRLIDDLYGGINSEAQKITKLYGSVNSQTKLIHQGFGHYDYGMGYVVYYTV